MATIDYHKLQQGSITHKPGSNWWFLRVDWALQNAAISDVFRLAEIKNHWIIKNGFSRATVDTNAGATLDLEIVAGGNELDAAFDPDPSDDIWVRWDTIDDDAPYMVEADGYINLTINTAALSYGVTDFLAEVIIPMWNVDAVDNLGN